MIEGVTATILGQPAVGEEHRIARAGFLTNEEIGVECSSGLPSR